MSGFRNVREAVQAGDTELMTANMASWANRLFVKYTEPIPPVEVSSLSYLSATTHIKSDRDLCRRRSRPSQPESSDCHGRSEPALYVYSLPVLSSGLPPPVLSVTEFMRAKIRVWSTYVPNFISVRPLSAFQ